jgi:hypothetical protein
MALFSNESASEIVLEFSSIIQKVETGKHKEVEAVQLNYNTLF